MSRDQRPRRPVLVDAANVGTAAVNAAPNDVPSAPSDVQPPVKVSLFVPTVLFLVACAAGAVGVSLLPIGGAQ